MIRIEISGDTAADVLSDLRALAASTGEQRVVAFPAPEMSKPEPEKQAQAEPAPPAEEEPRAYGQPSGDRKRRTKEEMAEDAEIERLAGKIDRDPAAMTGSATEILAFLRKVITEPVRKPVTYETPNISANPEDRQPPADEPALDGEILDDEAPAAEATRDDLKAAMTKLTEKHGMPAGLKIIGEVFAPYGKSKQSEFDDDSAIFAEVIAKLEARL